MNDYSNSRRDFLKNAALAGSVMTTFNPVDTLLNDIATINSNADTPWYRRITRWGQVNITERDPEQYDIGWWRKYWKQTNTQGVIINAGGIVAYYPTKVPFHKQA